MVITFTVVTVKNRRRGESMSGFIWRRTAKVCVKIRPIRRFRELCIFKNVLDVEVKLMVTCMPIQFPSDGV